MAKKNGNNGAVPEVKPDPEFLNRLVEDMQRRAAIINTELAELSKRRAELVAERKSIKAAIRKLG